MTGTTIHRHQVAHAKKIQIRPNLLLVVLFLLACVFFSTLVNFSAEGEEMRLAIVPFEDTRIQEGGEETVPGLGTTIASQLTALFVQHLPPGSGVSMIDQDVITMALDQAGMAEMGLIDADSAARVGEILDANYVWYGDYSVWGANIMIQATLWTLRSASARHGYVVRIPESQFIPDTEFINALVCQLFCRMYVIIVGEEPSISCPEISPSGLPLPKVIIVQAPFPTGNLCTSVRVGIGSVRMGAVNNIIVDANEVHSIVMNELRWAYEADIRAGYTFVPGLEVLGGIKYLGANRDAGGSANVSLTVSSIALMTGVAYHLRLAGIEFILEGRAGWNSANLLKRDQFGYLDCPARIAGNGISFESSISASMAINPVWSVQGVLSYRGMELPSTTISIPTLDFSGLSLGVSITATFGGEYVEVK